MQMKFFAILNMTWLGEKVGMVISVVGRHKAEADVEPKLCWPPRGNEDYLDSLCGLQF